MDAPTPLDDPLDVPADADDGGHAAVVRLMLGLMGRLPSLRGAALLADDEGALRVVAVRGRVALVPEQRLVVSMPDHPVVQAAVPEVLRAAGLALVVPLCHGGETLGAVALGPRAVGTYASADLAAARSLASATSASVRAGRTAARLVGANRALASRAHEMKTLFELAQAFGRGGDRDAILTRLTFTLMGQRLVRRVAVALRDPETPEALAVALVRGGTVPRVPAGLADLTAPCTLAPGTDLVRAGWVRAVPLRAGDVSRGVVLLGDAPAGAPAGADFEASLAALAVGALETADRVAEQVARERMEEELRLARQIQDRLLPPPAPPPDGLDVAVRWRPSREVSGDTYDVAPLAGGRLLVAVADVVGKGLGAALLMATVQAGFRLLRGDLDRPEVPLEALDLAGATARLDRLVADSTDPHQFVTLAWALLDAGSGQVVTIAAGHPSPRLLRADGTVVSLTAGGPLLGVVPGARFTAGVDRLTPGDTLVLITDGALEGQDATGDEFGPDRLDAALDAGAPTASALLDRLTQAVDAFESGGTEEADDLTLVAVRRVG